ncbi:putative ORfan [Saudi moumouvirus]|nr:putative ORfan [Saudi moumouvirus]
MSLSLRYLSSKTIYMTGVLIFLLILNNSLTRTNPPETVLPVPDLWKDFKLVCVTGSPILWAPTNPTISPPSTLANLIVLPKYSTISLNSSSLNLCTCVHFFGARTSYKYTFNKNLILASSCFLITDLSSRYFIILL